MPTLLKKISKHVAYTVQRSFHKAGMQTKPCLLTIVVFQVPYTSIKVSRIKIDKGYFVFLSMFSALTLRLRQKNVKFKASLEYM